MKKDTLQNTVIGEYDERGYRVYVFHGANNHRTELYHAGNHPQDSAWYVDLSDPEALPLGEIRRICIRATRELAIEQGIPYGGVTRNREQFR